MSLTMIITQAGITELVNAQNTGTTPIEITEIALGDGTAPASEAQTALHNETRRLSSIAGTVVDDDTISVTARDEGDDAYVVHEIGLITDQGTLFAVASQADPIIEKAASSTLLLTVDVRVADIDATDLAFGDTLFSNPPATTELLGVMRFATVAQADAGQRDDRAVTPEGLNQHVAQRLLAQAKTLRFHHYFLGQL